MPAVQEPFVAVNDVAAAGNFSPENALRAACVGFSGGAQPRECESLLGGPCERGAPGEIACNSGVNAAAGRTRCAVAASGFTCECALDVSNVACASFGNSVHAAHCSALQCLQHSQPSCASV